MSYDNKGSEGPNNIDNECDESNMGDVTTYGSDSIKVYEPKKALPIALFLTTLVTTILAGSFYEGRNPIMEIYEAGDFSSLSVGISFSLSLLFILGVHEFGHFFAAKKNGVKTTYPYFIPGPPLPPMIGTFGAVIKVKSPILTKKALIDIGAAGPLAGFVIAVGVTIWGFMLSDIVPINIDGKEHLGLGNSLLLEVIELLVVGVIPKGFDLALHPIAFAGWIGLFITALNLMPIGQLDGGHILYALVGKNHKIISTLIAIGLIILGSFTWLGWAVWGIFVFFIGLGHPPVEDDSEELTKSSKIVCLLSLIVFILTLIPTPFYIISL